MDQLVSAPNKIDGSKCMEIIDSRIYELRQGKNNLLLFQILYFLLDFSMMVKMTIGEIIRTLKFVNSRFRDNKSTGALALVWVSCDGIDN